MAIRATWLLHWSIRQIGQPSQYLPIEDLLLLRRSGQLEALLMNKGALPVAQLMHFNGGCALIAEPLDMLLDHSIPLHDARYTTAKAFLGKTLYDENRQRIGVIGDLQFIWPSGELEAIEVSQGLLKDLVTGRYHMKRKAPSF